MEQYFIGKSQQKFESISKENITQEIYFANERFNKKTYSNLLINYCTFSGMGFKACKFKQIDFSHCTFINCHFSWAQFEDVNFVDCRFINCNFGDITLIACDFRYAKFDGCYIQYRHLKPNLPAHPNQRRELTRNLAIECLNMGDADEYRFYYFEERKASEEHFWKTFIREEEWYKNKYGNWEAISGLAKLFRSKISKYLWGYGESVSSLLAFIGIIILMFSLLYYNLTSSFIKNSVIVSLNYAESLSFSISNFFSISTDFISNDKLCLTLSIAEHVIGLVLTGFLVAALFRSINRR